MCIGTGHIAAEGDSALTFVSPMHPHVLTYNMIPSHHTTIDIGQRRWNRSVIRHDDICNYNDSDNGYGLTLSCNILNIMTDLKLVASLSGRLSEGYNHPRTMPVCWYRWIMYEAVKVPLGCELG